MFSATFNSVGNPDKGQYCGTGVLSPVHTVRTASLKALQLAARKYQAAHDLGAGNWPETIVNRDGMPVGRMSYNGRVWATDGTEITE